MCLFSGRQLRRVETQNAGTMQGVAAGHMTAVCWWRSLVVTRLCVSVSSLEHSH